MFVLNTKSVKKRGKCHHVGCQNPVERLIEAGKPERGLVGTALCIEHKEEFRDTFLVECFHAKTKCLDSGWIQEVFEFKQ